MSEELERLLSDYREIAANLSFCGVGISVDDKKQPDGTRKICVGRFACVPTFVYETDSLICMWV